MLTISFSDMLAHGLRSNVAATNKCRQKEGSDENRNFTSLSSHRSGYLCMRAVHAFSIRHPFFMDADNAGRCDGGRTGDATLVSELQKLTK